MTDAKRATVPCWACGTSVQWDKAHRVVALREKHQPTYNLCDDCWRIVNAAQGVTK